MSTTIETMDARPIPHSDRLPILMKRLHNLPLGQSFRLVVDHSPVPLHFMLKGQSPGEFDLVNEKDGPDEWIVKITRRAMKKVSLEGSGS